MGANELFEIKPQEPCKMSQQEFMEKTKAVLNKICNSYYQSWQSMRLMDEEYPKESVCDKCTGCGKFIKNGEEKECFQNREQGECYYRFCDYEQVGIDVVTNLEKMCDLLSVDEIN